MVSWIQAKSFPEGGHRIVIGGFSDKSLPDQFLGSSNERFYPINALSLQLITRFKLCNRRLPESDGDRTFNQSINIHEATKAYQVVKPALNLRNDFGHPLRCNRVLRISGKDPLVSFGRVRLWRIDQTPKRPQATRFLQ